MVDDRKQVGDRDRPFHSGGRLIIHYQDKPDNWKGWGRASEPPGGEDRPSLELYQGAGPLSGVVAWGLLGPLLWDPPWPGE